MIRNAVNKMRELNCSERDIMEITGATKEELEINKKELYEK